MIAGDVKDLDTGKRVSRLNLEGEWITQEVPGLRIVGQNLWDLAKKRQGKLELTKRRRKGSGSNKRPAISYLGLLNAGYAVAGSR